MKYTMLPSGRSSRPRSRKRAASRGPSSIEVVRRNVSPRRIQLDDADAPDDADVAYHGKSGQRTQSIAQPTLEAPRPDRAASLTEQLQARECHRACQRIGRERVAVEERPLRSSLRKAS